MVFLRKFGPPAQRIELDIKLGIEIEPFDYVIDIEVVHRFLRCPKCARLINMPITIARCRCAIDVGNAATKLDLSTDYAVAAEPQKGWQNLCLHAGSDQYLRIGVPNRALW